MKTESSTYTSNTYVAFFAIDEGEYREKIRFIDRYQHSLDDLEAAQYAEIMDVYADALFEIGRYRRHLKIADELIELAIEHNIRDINGKDLFCESLFQKAASLYNLDRHLEAKHILNELLRIDPSHESGRLFLINCHVREYSGRMRRFRGLTLVLIFAAALVIAFEVVFLRPGQEPLVGYVEAARNVLFITGATFLIGGELAIRYRAVSKVYKLTSDVRKRKGQRL